MDIGGSDAITATKLLSNIITKKDKVGVDLVDNETKCNSSELIPSENCDTDKCGGTSKPSKQDKQETHISSPV